MALAKIGNPNLIVRGKTLPVFLIDYCWVIFAIYVQLKFVSKNQCLKLNSHRNKVSGYLAMQN